MKRAASRWLAGTLAIALGVMRVSTVVGQTPEEQKLWEAQRAQMHADEKAKADLLAKQRDARRADPTGSFGPCGGWPGAGGGG